MSTKKDYDFDSLFWKPLDFLIIFYYNVIILLMNEVEL
jgi:hypothetical protein